ncbi:hypothetical protein [Geitlerinema sp. PCC 7407]|uniref:hypothetical protein n=1 Tax=Geitlerinema sp. PCC 7407 TaxID=1173025 RepID=UPI00029FC69D|nr:hypothetical protein [Geitlerinema sp. PCC 7407]AFY66555.1 hypothetical protein GEI7407_2075 [Geitlerinema sp. PCC 7407]
MIKGVVILLGVLWGWLAIALPLQAAPILCRTLEGHQICVLSLKRSAKYFWEYRAKVRVDGKERPIEIYNCRDRLWTRADGKQISFETPEIPNGGNLICQLFRR